MRYLEKDQLNHQDSFNPYFMKTKLLYILILAFTVQSFGQRKYAADQYFKEYAYTKSADLYKEIFMKGDSSKLVLERLGDSYYYNTQALESELWYSKLINNYGSEVLPEYYFRYAQALKSNGNYEKSDEIMKKFRSLKSDDTRSEDLASTPDYVSAYSDNDKELINIHNVSINTQYSDFGGFIDNEEFYFASSSPKASSRNRLYKWNSQPFLDIYKAGIDIQELDDITKESILELSDKDILNDNINTRYHEANAIFTKDRQIMYFTRDNYDGRRRGKDKNRETHLKLYKSTLKNGEWSNVEELPFNSKDYSIGHPALSVDEKTLYFVSDMPGGIGATDIYSVSVDGENYGEPTNLGNGINTEGREMFPFISEDNVFYFSSDGHLGLGALDIFESKIVDNSFSKVKNIETPFNSKMDDFAFIVNKEKNKGFFSSNREGGKGDDDIYSFMISPKPIKPCMQSLNGIVTETITGNILPFATVKLIDTVGKVIATKQSDAQGAYSFTQIPCESAYTVLGEKKNYKSDRNSVTGTKEDGKVLKADLSLEALIIGNEIVINPIFFDFDKFNIRDEAAYELEKIVSVLNNNPDMVIKIESHTDSRATKAYNRRLSTNRAKSTRDYIVSRGIASNRIESAIGYGESQLLNDCDDANINKCSEAEHQRNRRSKFIIVSGNTNNVKVNDPNAVPLKKVDPKPGRY